MFIIFTDKQPSEPAGGCWVVWCYITQSSQLLHEVYKISDDDYTMKQQKVHAFLLYTNNFKALYESKVNVNEEQCVSRNITNK